VAISFTERELDIMTVLWDRGPSTAAEVRSALADDLAHTTVVTMLRILETKGYVCHTEEGRAHRFAPTVRRDAAGASALRRVVDRLFSGSEERVIAQLVQGGSLDRDRLRRLRRLLDERLGGPDEEAEG
jgi:predicted transcriptional regulator